jgi:hypothetical protein
MHRRLKLIPCVLLTSIALVVPTQGAVSGAATAKPHAPAVTHGDAKAGKWIQLSSSSGISNIDEPNSLRLPTGGIQAVWRQEDGTKQSIRTRIVKESGRIGSPISTVVKNWSNVASDPRIIRHGKKRLVAFGGIRSVNPGEQFTGEMAYALSVNGSAWTIGPGSLTETTYTSAYGTAAVDDGGTPFVGTIGTSTNVVTLHRGIDPSRPASGGDYTTKSGTFNNNSIYSSLAQDAKNHQIWCAWYGLGGATKHKGILVEKVYPKPPAKVLKAPGSTTPGGDSVIPDQNVAIAASSRGGVYVAYGVGYPYAKQLRIWQVGTRHSLTVKAGDAGQIMLATGPGGRMWLAWYNSTTHSIKAARTDPAVRHIGAIRSIQPPADRYSSVWKVTGSGASGPLHLVVNASPTGKNPQIWYQKVAPGLTLVAKPRTLDKGVVTAKVSDAGKAVANAKVTFRGQSKQTNGQGIAKFRVPGSAHSGRYAMKATRAGYFPGHASVKVT